MSQRLLAQGPECAAPMHRPPGLREFPRHPRTFTRVPADRTLVPRDIALRHVPRHGVKIAESSIVSDTMHTTETPSMSDAGLFDGIDAATLTEVTAAARTRVVPQGETLFEQGDDADSFFLLKAGSVKLTQLTPDGDVAILALLGAGDVLDGAAALAAGTHPVSAVAVTEAVTCEWPDAVMASLMERHGKLAVNALRLVATRLYDLQEQYRVLSSKKVERRIARALVRLIRHWGTRTGEGVRIELPMSPEDLAETARAALPAVSHVLRRFEADGIIDFTHTRVLIRKPDSLASIADEFE